MGLPYFFEKDIDESTNILSAETSKHCIQVLRMKAGEKMQLTDGKGNLFAAEIVKAGKQNCEVQVQKQEIQNAQQAPKISIAISILKNPTRLEWFMEKATEIGVKEIIPLICERTEKENLRYDRMNNILVSAMLQSKQTWLPQLHQPKKFSDFIGDDFEGTKLIAHCLDEQKKYMYEFVNQPVNKLILIGPEGDFSEAEIAMAIEKKFVPVSLGSTRLRTETAGIVAAALLSAAMH